MDADARVDELERRLEILERLYFRLSEQLGELTGTTYELVSLLSSRREAREERS